MENESKPLCKFGNECYRKNQAHFDIYSHPEKSTKLFKNESSGKSKVFSENRKLKKRFSSKTKKCSIKDEITTSVEEGVAEEDIGIGSSKKSEQHTTGDFNEDNLSDIRFSKEGDLKGKTVEEIIRILFLVNMPADFYSFYEFYKTVVKKKHGEVLKRLELKLVGPFDVLSDSIRYSKNQDFYLSYWRFYYDPPEFQTVLVTDSGFHMGYWRDDPKEYPVFLASNNPNKNYIFKVETENIFGTVFHYLKSQTIQVDPFLKIKITKLLTDLSDWAKKNEFSLEKKSSKINARQKKVVAKTFHEVGIVVPVDPKTELGYRPLMETDNNLKRICNLIANAEEDVEKEALWENLQVLITAANIANDECDFGNSLELGIDLFCMGSPVFHETVNHLLCTAYSLLNRTEYENVIKAHLKFRRKDNNLGD